MKFRLINATVLLFSCFLYSCSPYEEVNIKGADANFGYIPVDFVTEAGLKEYQLLEPQELIHPGKTIVEGRYLFIGENKKGIHVFDNIDPQNPLPLAFISVFGSVDFLFKDNTIVTTNGNDLVSINISAINEIAQNGSLIEEVQDNRNLFAEITRLTQVFTYPNYPEQQGNYFMCFDSAIYVTEWKIDSIGTNKDCFR